MAGRKDIQKLRDNDLAKIRLIADGVFHVAVQILAKRSTSVELQIIQLPHTAFAFEAEQQRREHSPFRPSRSKTGQSRRSGLCHSLIALLCDLGCFAVKILALAIPVKSCSGCFAFTDRTYAGPSAPVWDAATALLQGVFVRARTQPVSVLLTDGYETARAI